MATVLKYAVVQAANSVDGFAAAVQAKLDEVLAVGTLDFTVPAVDGDVLTIGSTVYTFVTSPASPGDVQTGGSEEEIAALLAAVAVTADATVEVTAVGKIVTVRAAARDSTPVLSISYDVSTTFVQDAASADAGTLVPGDAWQPYGSLAVNVGSASNGRPLHTTFSQAMVVYGE